MATTVLLPLLSIKLLLKSVKNFYINLFILNFIISASTEILLAGFHFSRLNNLFIVNSYLLIQFVILSMAFVSMMPLLKPRYVKVFYLLITLIFLLSITRLFYFISVKELDSISTPLESVALFILSGVNLVYLTKNSEVIIAKDYKFWFISASFLYFSISSVIFSTGGVLVENKLTLATYTWVINSVLTIISNIMYFIGIRCLPQKKN